MKLPNLIELHGHRQSSGGDFCCAVPAAPARRLAARLFQRLAATVCLLALSGCLAGRTRSVPRTVVVPKVLDATLDQLLNQLAKQDAAIQTLNATVDISASIGGEHEGQVREIPTCAGYIFLRRPGDLRILMLLPIVRSRALDMVSDGKQFKLVITVPTVPRKAITGADEFTSASRNGLENLRPYIIRDALLIPTAAPEEFVSLTKSSRILPPASGHKESTEEPDYDITVLRTATDHVQETMRVIHFGRVTLQPYQQDIYDHEGRIVTMVKYDRYQKFGDMVFPTSILITRPLDEYSLKIDISKLVVNGKLDDEQFVLKIPEDVPVQKM